MEIEYSKVWELGSRHLEGTAMWNLLMIGSCVFCLGSDSVILLKSERLPDSNSQVNFG